MKILHLTLKKKWFAMIDSGEKKEEYRAIKPYWINRLCNKIGYDMGENNCFKKYDAIKFRNGYAKNAPTITLKWLGCGFGNAKPEWSDNYQEKVFIIKLGEKINQ